MTKHKISLNPSEAQQTADPQLADNMHKWKKAGGVDNPPVISEHEMHSDLLLQIKNGPACFPAALKVLADAYAQETMFGLPRPGYRDVSRYIAKDTEYLMQKCDVWQSIISLKSEISLTLGIVDDFRVRKLYTGAQRHSAVYAPHEASDTAISLWSWDVENRRHIMGSMLGTGFTNNIILIFACHSLASVPGYLYNWADDLEQEFKQGIRYLELYANQLDFIERKARMCL